MLVEDQNGVVEEHVGWGSKWYSPRSLRFYKLQKWI